MGANGYRTIYGSATFAMLVSRNSMRAANATTATISHGFAVGCHGVAPCGVTPERVESEGGVAPVPLESSFGASIE